MSGKCRRACSLMDPYIDDMISDKDKRYFLKHITGCEKCRDEFNMLKYMLFLAKEIDKEEPPSAIKTYVMDKVRHIGTQKQRTPVPLIRKGILIAASSLAASIAVIFLLLNGTLLNGGLDGEDDAMLESDERAAYSSMDTDEGNSLLGMEEAEKSVPEQCTDYAYDISIDAEDPYDTRQEIVAMIDEAVSCTAEDASYDEPGKTGQYEIIISVTKEQGAEIIDMLEGKFKDMTVSVCQEEKDGTMRIIIK